MATILIPFRSSAFWLSISALEVWLYLLAKRISQMPEAPTWLREFGNAAETAAKSTAVQYVMPELDRYLTDHERVSAMTSLVANTLASTMEQFGSTISKDLLNGWGIGGGISTWSADLPTWKIGRIAAAYTKLIDGTIEEPLERAKTLDLMKEGGELWQDPGHESTVE